MTKFPLTLQLHRFLSCLCLVSLNSHQPSNRHIYIVQGVQKNVRKYVCLFHAWQNRGRAQFDFPVTVSADAVILAITISIITGVMSGLAPAYTASKMDPVDSLRYE